MENAPEFMDLQREAAYRIVVKKAHPDMGGNRETWDRVQEAIGVLRG
jgi:hypothetical protein